MAVESSNLRGEAASLSISDQIRSASPEYLILVVLAALGFLVLLSAVSRLLRGIWCVFLRPSKNLSYYGKWAVVTGCTDGIGKGFALELAKRKLSVVLISRNQTKLVELAQEIESKYKVETRVLAADFTEGELQPIVDRVEATLSDLDIGILINNVGLSYPHAQVGFSAKWLLMKI
jgi:17beta-estradiol 17-dehydrogenase / very-long-chain 3-oxoacyl-CoA reductase